MFQCFYILFSLSIHIFLFLVILGAYIQIYLNFTILRVYVCFTLKTTFDFVHEQFHLILLWHFYHLICDIYLFCSVQFLRCGYSWTMHMLTTTKKWHSFFFYCSIKIIEIDRFFFCISLNICFVHLIIIYLNSICLCVGYFCCLFVYSIHDYAIWCNLLYFLGASFFLFHHIHSEWQLYFVSSVWKLQYINITLWFCISDWCKGVRWTWVMCNFFYGLSNLILFSFKNLFTLNFYFWRM